MAAVDGYTINTMFDPYTQQFDLLAPDGRTPVSVSVADILLFQASSTANGIIYGTQIGLCALLLTILLLMTKSDKRRSPVFLLNATALLLLLVRTVLACVQLNGMFNNFYNWRLFYYPSGPALHHAMRVSATTEVFSFLVNVTIYSSMVLQIHIVCCTLPRWQQKLVVLGCVFAALLSLSVRLTLTVMNIKWLVFGLDTLQLWQNDVFNRVASANNIISVITIAFYSCVFVVKLAFAIVLRRKLRMKQFGPMQIIFIMGCQTLFVPRKSTPALLRMNLADISYSHLRDRHVLCHPRHTAKLLRAHHRRHLPAPLRHVGQRQHHPPQAGRRLPRDPGREQ